MAKRFSDTDKWKKPFLRGLKAPYKLLWLYILDECNHAGIWDVDLETAQIKIGEKIDLSKAIECFNGRILVFDTDTKWFIYDFIDFQYGELNELNRVHASVIQLLSKYSIDYKIKPLTSPLQGAMDKDKDKVKEKDKEYPFLNIEFREPFEKWLQYKTDRKEKYKSDTSIELFYKKLVKLSSNNPKIANDIVEQSMANNWAGIFELKVSNNGTATEAQTTTPTPGLSFKRRHFRN